MASFLKRHVVIMEQKKKNHKQELHRIAEYPAYGLKKRPSTSQSHKTISKQWYAFDYPQLSLEPTGFITTCVRDTQKGGTRQTTMHRSV